MHSGDFHLLVDILLVVPLFDEFLLTVPDGLHDVVFEQVVEGVEFVVFCEDAEVDVAGKRHDSDCLLADFCDECLALVDEVFGVLSSLVLHGDHVCNEELSELVSLDF